VIPAAIGLALLAAVLHGTWNVLLKVSGNPIVTLQRATGAAALLLTPVVGVAWLVSGRPSFPPVAMALCAVSAALELIYAWLLSAAYRRGELSVVYPIARGSAPLLAVIAGLALLGERLAPAQLAGVALLLLGILAVTLPQTSGRATLPALLTGVAVAAYTAIDRVGVRLTTPWLYGWLLVTLLAVGLFLSVRFAVRAGVGPDAGPSQASPVESPPATWRGAIVIGIFMWSGYFLVLWALSLAPLSVIAPVRETAVVAVAVWGVWRLRERRAWGLKLAGALATLVGIALLAL
jgi:drug/metabolite transporter (DMT)-like permease